MTITQAQRARAHAARAAQLADGVDPTNPLGHPRFRYTLGGTLRLASIDGGHVALIGPDYRPLHPRFHRAALSKGAQKEGDSAPSLVPDHENAEGSMGSAEGQDEAIKAGIQKLLEIGNSKDFSQDGIPKVASVHRVVGFPANKADIVRLFQVLKDEAGDGFGVEGEDE